MNSNLSVHNRPAVQIILCRQSSTIGRGRCVSLGGLARHTMYRGGWIGSPTTAGQCPLDGSTQIGVFARDWLYPLADCRWCHQLPATLWTNRTLVFPLQQGGSIEQGLVELYRVGVYSI